MYKIFGKQLQKERAKKGLTALMVAKDCGVSRSFITLIETGRRLPGKRIIMKIAVALRIKTGTALNWYLEDISQKMRENIADL